MPTSGSLPPPPPVWDARPPDPAVRYAGFWLRTAAAIIDGMVLSIAWWFIQLVLPTTPAPPVPDTSDAKAMLEYVRNLSAPREMIVYAVLVMAYYALQESSSAQGTLGKRMLGIRVSTTEGGRLNLGTATLRAWPVYLPSVAAMLGWGLSGLVGILAFVSCIAVAFSSRKQGLHDKMAGAILTRA